MLRYLNTYTFQYPKKLLFVLRQDCIIVFRLFHNCNIAGTSTSEHLRCNVIDIFRGTISWFRNPTMLNHYTFSSRNECSNKKPAIARSLAVSEWEARLRATKQHRCAVSWHIRSTCACRSRRPLAKLRNSTTKSSKTWVCSGKTIPKPTVCA